MKSLSVYLTFNGNCEEALNFYKYCLGGEILSMQRMGDSPMEVDEAAKNRIMHSEFKAQGVFFMASDNMPGNELKQGSQVTLNINFSDENEQEKVFNALAHEGQISMPLQDTFWGAKFGMLTDKFGIRWMVNCEKESK